ncbi:hypothetical protein FPV67DRAFT_1428896, partial [Lyophyllum atratum]
TKQLTLYTSKVCPYAHSVEIALEEAQLKYTRYEIDLENKPEWYASHVKPANQVPALTYGGPLTRPTNPSPHSAKITESRVLLEFIVDISGGKLLPADAVLRAKARVFIEAVSTHLAPAFGACVLRGEPGSEAVEEVIAGIEKMQALLPPDPEAFAVGSEFTIADVSVAPFLARLEVVLGSGEEGMGRKAYEALRGDPKFERYRRYWDGVKGRDSFGKTWDEVCSLVLGCS